MDKRLVHISSIALYITYHHILHSGILFSYNKEWNAIHMAIWMELVIILWSEVRIKTTIYDITYVDLKYDTDELVLYTYIWNWLTLLYALNTS